MNLRRPSQRDKYIRTRIMLGLKYRDNKEGISLFWGGPPSTKFLYCDPIHSLFEEEIITSDLGA